MTRVNSAIPVKYLTDEHLLAEHREIKRLPMHFRRALSTGALRRIPRKFCLGTGHVNFFLNKQAFLFTRYQVIYRECIARGFKVEDYSDNWLKTCPLMQIHKCWNHYEPTTEEKTLLTDRISERILASRKPRFHYYGNSISKPDAIDLLLGKSNYAPKLTEPISAEILKTTHPELTQCLNLVNKDVLDTAKCLQNAIIGIDTGVGESYTQVVDSSLFKR